MTEENSPKAEPSKSLSIPGTIASRLLLDTGLVKTESKAVAICVLLFVLISLGPLFILSILSGVESDPAIKLPLHSDYITLVRLLAVGPILIITDFVTRPWMTKAAERFLEITEEKDARKIRVMFRKTFRFQNSLAVNLCVLCVAFSLSLFGANAVLEIGSYSWQEVADTNSLTMAGYWNVFVSQPMSRYIIIGWALDYMLWIYFVWRVSKFKLRIFPTHPDGVGGLGFLRVVQTQFCLPAFALSASVCSMIAQMIHYSHADIHAFTNLWLVFIVLSLVLFALPLLFFTPKLLKTKMQGVFSYGSLCSDMSKRFQDRWIVDKAKQENSVLDSADPSALCDLGGGYQFIDTMKPTLIDKQFLTSYLVVTNLAAVPLIASVMPIQDILKQIVKSFV